MKTTVNIKLSTGKISGVNLREDNTCELVIESKEPVEVTVDMVSGTQKSKEGLMLIEASKLSLKDRFMQYEPKTNRERNFKMLLISVIKKGVKDFYRPSIDPSFNEDKTGICYVRKKKPAVGMSYNWWHKTAKEYDTARGSRLGTKSEYIAFLGVLIKRLVEEGWPVEDAWQTVCCDSKKLGHYWNSVRAKHGFETTGSREIYGFFDLANTFKILVEDEGEEAGGFWLAGGYYRDHSGFNPLADLCHDSNRYGNRNSSVGWLVLEEGSTDH